MTTDKARAEAEARYYVECYAEHFDPHLDPEQRSELFALFLKALTARDAEAEGLREAVLTLATEIRLRIIEREAFALGEPDAWIKRSAVLKFVIEERLAHPIAKAAVERAGGDR